MQLTIEFDIPEPGVQLYTAGFLDGSVVGRGGKVRAQYLCHIDRARGCTHLFPTSCARSLLSPPGLQSLWRLLSGDAALPRLGAPRHVPVHRPAAGRDLLLQDQLQVQRAAVQAQERALGVSNRRPGWGKRGGDKASFVFVFAQHSLVMVCELRCVFGSSKNLINV